MGQTHRTLCLETLSSWIHPKGSRKRQVMSPTMALVSTRPFTFSQLLRSQYLLLLLLQLGLITGTVDVPTLLSLAHFNNRLSRAESLFTTFTHATTTYYRVDFAAASACTNAFTIAMIIAILAFSRPCTDRAGLTVQGGSRESHLTNKQTRRTRLPFLLLLLLTLQFPHSLSHTHSINSVYWTDSFGSICSIHWWCWWCVLCSFDCFYWQFPYICLCKREIKRKTLLAKKFSLSEVCAHNLDRREWRKMSQLYRGFGFPFLASNWVTWVTLCHLPLGFPFLATNCVFHCHASAGCLLGLLYLLITNCGISLLYKGFFTTSLSWVAASSARQTGLTKWKSETSIFGIEL